MPRRLKVFQARFGFHDSVVAVPSQAAALRAWGTHQNLFADGQASIATDPRAVAAALADPGTPLLRAVGAEGAFERAPTALPKLPDQPAVRRRRDPGPGAKSAARRPPPDRTALDAAEAALRALEEGHLREEADFRQRRDELDRARDAARATYAEKREAAEAALASTRERFSKSGGEA